MWKPHNLYEKLRRIRNWILKYPAKREINRIEVRKKGMETKIIDQDKEEEGRSKRLENKIK